MSTLMCFGSSWIATFGVGSFVSHFLAFSSSVPQWLTELHLFLWLVLLLKKTKLEKVNLFLVRKLRD